MAANAGPDGDGNADIGAEADTVERIDANADTDIGTDTDGTDGDDADGSAGAGEMESGKRCPICGAAYDSVSVHETGLMVNLLDNERYRRVCFDPVDENGPRIRFYHHTHAQTAPAE